MLVVAVFHCPIKHCHKYFSEIIWIDRKEKALFLMQQLLEIIAKNYLTSTLSDRQAIYRDTWNFDLQFAEMIVILK